MFLSLSLSLSLTHTQCASVCVHDGVCARTFLVCVCVCVCVRERERDTHTHTHTPWHTHNLIGDLDCFSHSLRLCLCFSPRLSLFLWDNLFEPQSDGILFIGVGRYGRLGGLKIRERFTTTPTCGKPRPFGHVRGCYHEFLGEKMNCKSRFGSY